MTVLNFDEVIEKRTGEIKAYIYNVKTQDVVFEVEGDTNEECEDKANAMGYMGTDEYGLIYSDRQLNMQ